MEALFNKIAANENHPIVSNSRKYYSSDGHMLLAFFVERTFMKNGKETRVSDEIKICNQF